MEILLASAVGVLTAAGIYLVLRLRTFPVIVGLSLLSYAVNVFLFATGRLVLNQPPILSKYVSDYTDAAGDSIPSLRRVSLVNSPSLQNQLLISGVANLQVQFGEDLNNDQVIDLYADPDDVSDWSAVYAAKIWLLMRSDDKQVGINTKKTYSIAGTSVDYGGQDDYRYFLVTSVVNLRNMKQL